MLIVAPELISLSSGTVTVGAELLSSSEMVTVYFVIAPKLLSATGDKSITKVSLASSSVSSIMLI